MLVVGSIDIGLNSVGFPILAAYDGATSILLYALPDQNSAQPRAWFFGSIIGSILGVGMQKAISPTWIAGKH